MDPIRRSNTFLICLYLFLLSISISLSNEEEQKVNPAKVCFFCESGEYVDNGGFGILKTQASLYKQIWAKCGPKSGLSRVILSQLWLSETWSVLWLIDMHQCHFMDLSTEMIWCLGKEDKDGWEIWISHQLVSRTIWDCEKRCLWDELLELSQPLHAAKSKLNKGGWVEGGRGSIDRSKELCAGECIWILEYFRNQIWKCISKWAKIYCLMECSEIWYN